MNTNWESLIGIDRNWVNKQLNSHNTETYGKIAIRGYTVKPTGTTVSSLAISQELRRMLIKYVFGKSGESEYDIIDAFANAVQYFGKKDPVTDGKYGELLLFALVEGVLGCKMVAHKLKALSNFRDQVKGGDGIFLGEYPISATEKKPAYLVGESKIMQGFAEAMKDAYDSINRFHDALTSGEFSNTELIVARQNMITDEKADLDVDELYDRLTPDTELYRRQILVHPVLLMYNTNRITSNEVKAKSMEELEDLLQKEFKREGLVYYNKLNKELDNFPKIKKVYLDFFIIPYNDVTEFRYTMYHQIHGVRYSA